MELGMIRERILGTPLVSGLPEEMRKRFVMILLWISETRDVSRKDVLFKLGDKDTGTGCIVLEGMVRIITEESDKKTIEAPDILGEVQLFTPEGKRTATVEVVVGGSIMTFEWKALGTQAKAFFSEDELSSLKKIIAGSAWRREDALFEKLKHG